MMHRRESTLLVGRAGPALSVDILTLMPPLAPETRKARDEVKVRHLPDHRRMRRQMKHRFRHEAG
jgi:hypothetical protein